MVLLFALVPRSAEPQPPIPRMVVLVGRGAVRFMALVPLVGIARDFLVLVGLGYLWGERRALGVTGLCNPAHCRDLGRVRKGFGIRCPRALSPDGSFSRRHGVAARSEDPPRGSSARCSASSSARCRASRLDHDRAAAAVHHHDGAGAGDRLPRRHLLRGQLRRLDHRDPGQFAGRPVGLGHRVRRLSDGAAGRAGARSACPRFRARSAASSVVVLIIVAPLLSRGLRSAAGVSRSPCSACRWWR